MLRYSSLEKACSNFHKIAAQQKVLLIGDSLAVGLNAPLKQRIENAGIPYKGKGVGSKTVWYWTKGEGRQWLNHQLKTFQPTHVFICLGTNDAYGGMSTKQIASLTQELTNTIKSSGATPLWIGAPTLPDKSAGVPIKRNILGTIQSNTKHFFDSREVNLPHSKVDKIHPTGKGYSQWADEIWSWATTGKQSPSAPNVNMRAMKDSEVTPALSKAAVAILKRFGDRPLGTLIAFTLGGEKYIAKISWHPPTSRNPKWHKGVDLHYPTGEERQTNNYRSDGLIPVRGLERTTPEFKQKLIQVANDVDIDPNMLATVISLESGFNPKAVNKYSYATGLIQWMPSNIQKYYGVPPRGTKLDLQGKKMASEWMKSQSALKQLDMVKRWYMPHKGKIHNVKDAYLAVFMPNLMGRPSNYVAAREGSIAYGWNKTFDRNKKGYYTVGDIAATIQGRYNAAKRGKPIPVAQAPTNEFKKPVEEKPVEEEGIIERIIRYLLS